MQYHAKPKTGNEGAFYFATPEEIHSSGRDLDGCEVTYVGHDPVVRDLLPALSTECGAKEAVELIESVDDEARLMLLYGLQRQGLSPRDALEIPEVVNGRIVVHSEVLSPDYHGRIESEEDALKYYLWKLADFKDYRGFMTKRDFFRFFDYEAFIEHRGVVTFAHAGVFYVLMLWGYNHK